VLHEVVTVRGIPLTVYQHEAVSEVIRQTGDFYEADILDELREMYPTQRTIVDVGANIGNHSAYWSAFVPNTAIHAFEPVPDNYELLVKNVPDAVCHPSALSERSGRLKIELDRVNMGRGHVVTMDAGPALWVTARSLDAFGLDDVSLIKLDVEGHEGKVLGGAVWTIGHSHTAIVVEDEWDEVGDHLMWLGIKGYRKTREWPGHNDLWEWR